MFDGVVEDRKQNFRFEQIETEGNDPTETGEKAGDEEDMARKEEWGGSEPDPARYEINKNGATKESQRDADLAGTELVANGYFAFGETVDLHGVTLLNETV